MCLVKEVLGTTERKAWMEEIEISVASVRVERVMNGLPRTRKQRREGGRSRVTLRSLKEEMMWLDWEEGEEMVRSGTKVW